MARVAHDWETSSTSKSMKIEEDIPSSIFNLPHILDASEAERFIEGLQKFTLEEVGSSRWMEQHQRIEKLNLQAHHNAMTNSDEYVLEAILTFGKLELLIEDLLIIEAWKENVYPLLLPDLAGKNNMRLYFVLYHEATLVNLLEVLFYHKHVCEAGGERMIEIADYVARKLTRLSSGYDFSEFDPTNSIPKTEEYAKKLAEAMVLRDPREEMAQYLTEIEFKVCISAVAITRFLCEHADGLPLSVASRITDTHDMLVLIIPLIENPPWTRRSSSGKWQKLVDHKWTEVAPIDLLKVTKLEGQVWIALYHLLAKQVFRERYHLNTFRKGQVLRARKYINDLILDQLPFLADIQRHMDELALSEVADVHSSVGGGVFMFQQVSVMRETLLRGKDWTSIAEYQRVNIFTMTDKDDMDVRAMAEMYTDDLAEGVFDPQDL